MRCFLRANILSALVFLLLLPPLAHAQAPGNPEGVLHTEALDLSHATPLMIIRFNQPHLGYANPLYDTVSAALKAKPSAVFDLISVSPRGETPSEQANNDKIAAENTHKVLLTLHNMGLPAQRISLVSALDNVASSEVRIFVH